jgi:hypothetical protein
VHVSQTWFRVIQTCSLFPKTVIAYSYVSTNASTVEASAVFLTLSSTTTKLNKLPHPEPGQVPYLRWRSEVVILCWLVGFVADTRGGERWIQSIGNMTTLLFWVVTPHWIEVNNDNLHSVTTHKNNIVIFIAVRTSDLALVSWLEKSSMDQRPFWEACSTIS